MLKKLAWAAFGAILTLAIIAAVPVTPPGPDMPTQARVCSVRIDNGVTEKYIDPDTGDESVVWKVPPTITVYLKGCTDMLDSESNQMYNEFGEKAYNDDGWTAHFRITDPAVLATYLEGVWEPLMTGAYTEFEKIPDEDVDWKKKPR